MGLISHNAERTDCPHVTYQHLPQGAKEQLRAGRWQWSLNPTALSQAGCSEYDGDISPRKWTDIFPPSTRNCSAWRNLPWLSHPGLCHLLSSFTSDPHKHSVFRQCPSSAFSLHFSSSSHVSCNTGPCWGGNLIVSALAHQEGIDWSSLWMSARRKFSPSAPSTRPSDSGCQCLAIQIHEKSGSVPVLQASLKSLTYSQTDRWLDVGLVRDALARTWKFSGEFSLFLSVVTHWGGSCGQSTEILDDCTCTAVLCPDPAHHQVPAGASCLPQVSQHPCMCDHSTLTFIPPNNSGKERLD